MVIKPFSVTSLGKVYTYVDRDALDSEAIKSQVHAMHGAALDFVQTAGLCVNRGLPDRGAFDNIVFAVFDASDLVGIWMLGCLVYVSGPWEDSTGSKVIDPGADVSLEAVPMAGLLGMAADVEATLAADTAAVLVDSGKLLTTVEGRKLGFRKLSYPVFKRHQDPISKRAQSHHAKVLVDARLTVTETPDTKDPQMTIAEITAKPAGAGPAPK